MTHWYSQHCDLKFVHFDIVCPDTKPQILVEMPLTMQCSRMHSSRLAGINAIRSTQPCQHRMTPNMQTPGRSAAGWTSTQLCSPGKSRPRSRENAIAVSMTGVLNTIVCSRQNLENCKWKICGSCGRNGSRSRISIVML